MTAETLDTQHGRESGVADLFQDLPVAAALHDLRDPAGALEVNARFTATFGYSASELGNLTGWAKTAYPDEAERKGALDRILASVESHRRTGRVPPRQSIASPTNGGAAGRSCWAQPPMGHSRSSPFRT